MSLSVRMLCVYVVFICLGVARVLMTQDTARPKAVAVPARELLLVDDNTTEALYLDPLREGTLREGPWREREEGGTARKVADFFYELEWVCQKAGSGELFLADGNSTTPTDERMFYRSERDEVLQLQITHAPVDWASVVVTDEILWTGLVFGTMTHIGHWIVYTATPLMVFLKEYLGLHNEHRLRLNCAVPDKSGWVYQVTSIFTDYTNPVGQHIPNTTTCYPRGYFGFPTTTDPTMSFYFDDHAHIFYQMIRERFRKWAGIAYSPRYNVQVEERPMVTLTIRTSSSGFGRNLTNAGEVKEYLDNNMGNRVRSQVISWNHYTVREQMRIGRDTDVMVGVHGNNLIWMMVMDPMRAVIELLPFGSEGAHKGINPAFGDYKYAFYSYVGQRANQSFLTWTASTPTHSPLAPPEEFRGKVFSHRCVKRKHRRPRWSARLWMCRHLTPPPTLIANLINESLGYLGRYDGIGRHGLFPFEERDLTQGKSLL